MTSWNLFLVSKIFSPDSTSLELLYTSSPTPSRLVHGPVPRTILPPRNIRTRDSAVPRPNESHFRQQQLSDHTIFVFSIWHGCVGIYRGTGRGEGGEGGQPTFSSRRFTAGSEAHSGALVLLQRPVKKSILFLRTTVVTVDIPWLEGYERRYAS